MYPSFRAEHFTSKQPDQYPSRVDDKPVFLERREPVIYSKWKTDSPLSKEQHDFY